MNYSAEKTLNIQKETAYILYMIIGSYFHKCICKSKMMEKNLLLYYKEMTKSKQEYMEQQIIRKVEQLFGKKQTELANMNSEATISIDENVYQIVFRTWFEDVAATVDKKGKYEIKLLDQEPDKSTR